MSTHYTKNFNVPSGISGFLIKSALFILITFSTLTSCQKDKLQEYEYFVSKDFKITYKTEYINKLIDAASLTYPELNDLKEYVEFDEDVYRIVYETTINQERINASGLICVPKTPGEYPVLCFQNGTNTDNAYSPGEYFFNPAYQMIEVVASMGYIVVMPDYPGFGESADIPHPYLVKDLTTTSTADMLRAVIELGSREFRGITIKNEIFLMGYSQGGWATLALHKSIELEHPDELNLKGSVCGSGPYNLITLFQNMVNANSYSMPVYTGYILNAYSEYKQFTNPVSDIFKEPYASRLSNLYNGTLSSSEINSQLTTLITDLFTEDFLSGFESGIKYSSVRAALEENSITAWNTKIPLFFIHGGSDNTVYSSQTDNIYDEMIMSGTSSQISKKEILPGLDHEGALVPALVKGLLFVQSLQ